MWFIGVEVEQETSAPPPKKNPGSAPAEIYTASLSCVSGPHAGYFNETNQQYSFLSSVLKKCLKINKPVMLSYLLFNRCLEFVF